MLPTKTQKILSYALLGGGAAMIAFLLDAWRRSYRGDRDRSCWLERLEEERDPVPGSAGTLKEPEA